MGELIANRLDEEGMAAHVGADSLHYVSVDGLLRAIRGTRGDTCLACFTGQYPIPIDGLTVSASTQQAPVLQA